MKVDIYNTDKKYNIIYADPPWSYKVWSKKGTQKAGIVGAMKLRGKTKRFGGKK